MRSSSNRNRSESLEPLKAKSRQRREQLARLSVADAQAGVIRNDLLPKLQLIDRAPAEVSIPARNVRGLDPAHIRETASAISHLGFSVPILIDHENNLVDGAVRLEAAKLLGLPHVPCIVVSHLSSSERRLLRIAMNRLQEKGEWNLNGLKIELQELILEDAPIEDARRRPGRGRTNRQKTLLAPDIVRQRPPTGP